jgi:hypothetical protein
MEFNYIADGIDAVVIDNFYTEKQLSEIMLELKWLTKPSILLDESHLVTAKTVEGHMMSSKNGVFLENVFAHWEHSALISHCMTQTHSDEFRNSILKFNTMFKSLMHCNARSHLLSYYENSDYYKPHTDSFFFTLLNYFNTEPKQFSGGEIVLKSCISDKEATIEPLNNRVVLIASATTHEVKAIKSNTSKSFTGDGRYSNGLFLTTRHITEMTPK